MVILTNRKLSHYIPLMIRIYHFPRTRGFRVIWLCEELKIPYEVINIDFAPEYRFGKDYGKLNPLGKVPTLVDEETIMSESGAMLQYVLDKFGGGRLQPGADESSRAAFLQWCWFGEATFTRPISEIVNHKRNFPENPKQDVIDEMKKRCRACMNVVEKEMEGKDYILGNDFSAADIMIGYNFVPYTRYTEEALSPNVASYFERLSSREAFKRAVEAEAK